MKLSTDKTESGFTCKLHRMHVVVNRVVCKRWAARRGEVKGSVCECTGRAACSLAHSSRTRPLAVHASRSPAHATIRTQRRLGSVA